MKIKNIIKKGLLILPFILLGCKTQDTISSSINSESSEFSSEISSNEPVSSETESSKTSSISSISSESSTIDKPSSSFSSSSSKDILSSSSSINSSSNSSSSSPNSSSSSISTTSEQLINHLGTMSISEVREYCKQVTDLNSHNIGVDMFTTVTIKGLAFSKLDLVKSTKKFGLNVSTPGKVFLADSTGYIACASPITSDGNSLWGKVADYAGKETSTYEVTGYLSIYLGQPELYVPGKTYTWNQNLDIKVNYSLLAKESLTLDQYYEKATAIQYNCAGHGYSDMYTVKNIKCIDNKDSVYMFTDGNSIMRVIKRTASFVVGKTYDITGYISTQNYIPALNAFEAKISGEQTQNITKDKAVETTINSLKTIKTSQDDTDSRFDSFISSFKYLRKATVYVSEYLVNGKYYVTVSDNFDSSDLEITSRNTAHTSKGMVDITNDNYWNVTWDEIILFCPIGDYVNENETIDIYYTGYQLEYTSGKPLWKIFIFNEFLSAK